MLKAYVHHRKKFTNEIIGCNKEEFEQIEIIETFVKNMHKYVKTDAEIRKTNSIDDVRNELSQKNI